MLQDIVLLNFWGILLSNMINHIVISSQSTRNVSKHQAYSTTSTTMSPH
jgi:hypothetical protein